MDGVLVRGIGGNVVGVESTGASDCREFGGGGCVPAVAFDLFLQRQTWWLLVAQ